MLMHIAKYYFRSSERTGDKAGLHRSGRDGCLSHPPRRHRHLRHLQLPADGRRDRHPRSWST